VTLRRTLPVLVLALCLIPFTSSAAKKKKGDKDAAPAVTYRTDQAGGTPEQIMRGGAAFGLCASCHGPEGEGNVGLAPRLNSQAWLTAVSNDFIRTTIKNGRKGSNMIPWYNGLGDDTVNDLVAFIRSWQKQPGKELDESPLKGDGVAGQRLFFDVCASCHGVRGAGYAAGVDGIGIGRKDFLDNASDGFLRAMIRDGKSGTLMESFSSGSELAADRLTPEQIDSIIVYLRGAAF
jgi:cbb3-type cytochrome c oxidase subunit III